ncbi:hypothetical protein MGWOODY_Mmi1093 [hydrothermal vent metagenome]|uniref:Twin-arginine translocation signal domain-containing protein n=1 Tax=hydrothermal vent metagenome TaxID=652676 RepID=A0A160VEY8_9ZZZZ
MLTRRRFLKNSAAITGGVSMVGLAVLPFLNIAVAKIHYSKYPWQNGR